MDVYVCKCMCMLYVCLYFFTLLSLTVHITKIKKNIFILITHALICLIFIFFKFSYFTKTKIDKNKIYALLLIQY